MKFFSKIPAICAGVGLLFSVLIAFPAQAQTDTDADTSAILPTTEAPSDIVLLLDNSGSMKVNDPQFLTSKAVTQFINQLDNSTQLAIVIFDQKVKLAHPLTAISDSSRPEMLNSLKQINYKGLHTNSPAGLERALFELGTHAREDSEKFIVLLTDGIVDTGDKQKDLIKVDWMRKELAAEASEHGIKIFGIAFTDNADFQLLQSLAQQTNAEYFRAYSADKLAGVFDDIQKKIMQVRQEAIQAAIEANKPPPEPVVVPVAPPAPAKPIIVQLPEQSQNNKMTRYMLFGIAGLLILLLVIILVRGRSTSGAGQGSPGGLKIPEVTLNDMRGVTNQQSYTLKTQITQIGRIKGKETEDVSYIVIPEKGVSRHHAVIEFRNNGFWVMDQGSGNGTKLNNVELTEEKHLKHGDILTFDTFNFMFSEPDMEQSDATVVQASSKQRDVFDQAFGEDESNKAKKKDESTVMLSGRSSDDGPSTEPGVTASSQDTLENLNDIIEDIGDWGSDLETDAPVTPAPPEPKKDGDEPKDPVEAGLVKQTQSGFEPAKTMTPSEFDRLFAEVDNKNDKT